MQINAYDAAPDLSRLIKFVESGREKYITLSMDGRPVARIVPLSEAPVSKRIGVAKGKFTVPDDFDAGNEKIAAMLTGEIQ